MKALTNSCTAAATSATTTAAPMAQRSSKSWDHVPRKKRRYSSEMNLMLLIFVGCCSCLILWPHEAAAASTIQDFGSVTAKGENIFMLASSNNDDDLGNALPDEVPGDADEEEEGDGYNGDATNVGKMPLMPNARKEHVPAEDIEMMQPPHNMRHQEHYKQRILAQQQLELGLNDLKPQHDSELSLNNRHLRYQQIQQALREPITPLPPQQQQQPIRPQQHHHRHHEHHYQQQQQPHHHLAANQEEFKWPLPHRSRQHQHQHPHHHEHLRHHRRHNFTSTATTTATTTTTMRPRYFDRDGLYTNPLAWIPTTQGPLHSEHTAASKRHFNPHNHLFNDEDMAREDNKPANDDDEDKQEEFKRISLSLDANKENTGSDKLFDALSFDDDDDDTDYSYEDDIDEDRNRNRNTPSSLVDNTKINVKRYTNPLRPPYKTPASSPSSSSSASSRRRQHPSKNSFASASNDDNFSEDYESNDDEGNNRSVEEPNVGDNFSDEKWNKIEHEHYRKQQQHQRAMQALRSRRPSPMDNTPNSIMKTATNNKFSSTSKSATSAKRQILNDDDTDNIYSRYYVPGSVTRKKEEELGSPTAMLESRRQYALQQRQNKAFASAHHRRIVKEGSCRLPQPRVERIRRDSWKIYTPHCTILHRCADDTGCCPTERQTCAPKRTKNVDLYFFVITLNETQGSIERLTFVNHTECHCVDKSKQRSGEYEIDGPSSDIASNHIPYLRRATILNCNCPNLYEKILQEDGFCRCDCSSGNMGCDWLKRGMEHFSMNDRKCISEGRCKLPTCEYGAYMKKLGRCPRREERQVSVDTVDW